MTQTNYDSELCGSLPIHLTNSIQPHGVLVIIDRKSYNIIQISENAEVVFGIPFEEALNRNLASIIGEKEVESLQKFSGEYENRLPMTWTIAKKDFLVTVHSRERYFVAEIDLTPVQRNEQDSFVKVFQDTRQSMSAIESGKSIEDVCRIAAEELKRISGFDKIMIYRFDEDWNGTVVAEVKEKGMESYMGFTFPASDIPKQARHMYSKIPYRLIPDSNYKAVRLYPVMNPITQSFIDLSDTNLRSVAGVHLEYLRNMGVTASMSIRILKDNTLWGLIACHHRAPNNPSYQMRAVFELLSNIISSKISAMINSESHDFDTEVKERYTNVLEEVYKKQSLQEAFFSTPGVLELFNATGALMTKGDQYVSFGDVPDKAQVDDLILWLQTRDIPAIFSTESLPALYDQADEYKEIASGFLAIRMDYTEEEYLILFRPEVVKLINWGGNPEERIQFEKDQRNYHPRNSFKQWQQKVSGTSEEWEKEELQAAEKLRAFIMEYKSINSSYRS
ncbi:MAG TPA: GAF domain-containing protein [Chryseosolibacter sp.]